MRTRAQDGDPSALDVGYLAGTYGVPEPDLHTLLSEPTVELVQNLFVTLTGKGAELDALKADKVKAEVELENTVRSSETKVKAQKAAVARHTKEIEELRTKLNEADAAREALSSEIEQLRSSTTGSTAETQQLRQRIETLEASNRDALALVESKSNSDFKDFWAKTKLPATEAEVRAELEKAGITPTSQVKEVKKVDMKKKDRKRAPRRGGKQTNSHMNGILKDYARK